MPPQRFESFWSLVESCLAPDGRVFVIDELPEAGLSERSVDAVAPTVERRLKTGARHRTVKVFHNPSTLEHKLAALGWQFEIHTVGWRFFYASGHHTS